MSNGVDMTTLTLFAKDLSAFPIAWISGADPAIRQKDDIPRITRLLDQNLKNKCPELSNHLQAEIEKMTKEEI